MDNEAPVHLEQELREYKKFFDETPVAFMRTDLRTGRFLMANKACATLFGYESVVELLQKRKSSLYAKEDRQRMIQKLRKEGSIENYEMKLYLKDERIIWVSAWLHINCGGTCIEGSLIDITPQKEVEFELDMLKNKSLKCQKVINEKLDSMVSYYAE